MKNITLTLALIIALSGGQFAQAKSITVCQGIEPTKGTIAFLLDIEWGPILTKAFLISTQEALVHIKSKNKNQVFKTVFTNEYQNTRCAATTFQSAKIGANLAKIYFSHVWAHSCGSDLNTSILTTYPDTTKAAQYQLKCQDKTDVLLQ